MTRITADKKEAAATQKAVALQEQEANEQAAQVCRALSNLPQHTHTPAAEHNEEKETRNWMYSLYTSTPRLKLTLFVATFSSRRRSSLSLCPSLTSQRGMSGPKRVSRHGAP